MLDDDIAEKMKDEYPSLAPPTDINSINLTLEKPSNTDLSSIRSDQNESDSEIENFEDGRCSTRNVINY